MAPMSPAYRDREQDKFKETPSGLTSVRVSVEADSPVPVYISESTNRPTITVSGEVNALAQNVTATVFSYVVPPNKKFILEKVFFDGTNIAEYKIEQNGATFHKFRTYFGDNLSGSISFESSGDGVAFYSGDVIAMKVKHIRPMLGDFFCLMIGFLSDD